MKFTQYYKYVCSIQIWSSPNVSGNPVIVAYVVSVNDQSKYLWSMGFTNDLWRSQIVWKSSSFGWTLSVWNCKQKGVILTSKSTGMETNLWTSHTELSDSQKYWALIEVLGHTGLHAEYLRTTRSSLGERSIWKSAILNPWGLLSSDCSEMARKKRLRELVEGLYRHPQIDFLTRIFFKSREKFPR